MSEPSRRTYSVALWIVGILCLTATIIHGAWYWYMPGYAELRSMDRRQLDTMQLLNAAITLFLFVTGVATVAVARTRTLALAHVRGFALILLGFWAGRFLLELAMPLQIPLLFIQQPGLLAKVIMGLPVVVLLVPMVIDVRHARLRSPTRPATSS